MQQLLEQNATLLNKVNELIAEMKPLKSMVEQLVANNASNSDRLKALEENNNPVFIPPQKEITPVGKETKKNVTPQPDAIPTPLQPIAQPPQIGISAEGAFIAFLNQATLEDLKALRSRAHSDELNGLIERRKTVGQFKSKEDCLQQSKGEVGLTLGRYDTLFDKWKQKRYQAHANDNMPTATHAEVTIQNNVTIPQESESSVVPMENTQKPKNGDAVQPMSQSNHTELLPLFTSDNKESVINDTESNSKSVATSSTLPLTPIEKLNNMNKEELAVFLNRRKFKKTVIEAIIQQRPFVSFDAINVEGLGAMTKQRLIQAFK